MAALDDLKVFLKSNSIIVIESREEKAIVAAFKKLMPTVHKTLFSWSVTTGLKRLDKELPSQKFNNDPYNVLEQINSSRYPGVYLLPDFHPYLSDPKIVRMIKEIAQNNQQNNHSLVFISHEITLPDEVSHFVRSVQWSTPNDDEILAIINEIALEWGQLNGRDVVRNSQLVEKLANNLKGLSRLQVRKLARSAVHDGVIDESDIPAVMKAKYELLDDGSSLSFEYETASFSELGGQEKLKQWLKFRKDIFLGEQSVKGLDPPKGIMLLGVQGCGKSLAAKAVAGIFGVPLLRLDFGAIYNKFHGETEKNLREALKTASLMEPCVLWMDEIEKGLSSSESDEGTSKRILGSLLTWMAEKSSRVFLVATSNDIESMPPELIRKGRLDEIFFVDLPDVSIREKIFNIHLQKREQAPDTFNIPELGEATEGFSGAEIEQVIVSGFYTALGNAQPLDTAVLLKEIRDTYPLSVTMAEKVQYLRDWAVNRAVLVD